MAKMTEEQWREIPGYDGLYEVSDMGGVRSAKGLRKTPIGSHGYPNVTLTKDHEAHTFTVHALVMLAFVGPCPPGLEILHEDDDRRNPRLTNLRYGTPLENKAQMKARGRQSRGESRPLARLTDAIVREIRFNSFGVSDRALAKKYGVSHAAIGLARSGKTWRHV